MSPRRFLCMAVLGIAALSGVAHGKPSRADIVEARKAVAAGKRSETKKEWEAAREAFQRAVELDDSAGARIGLARAEDKLGHLLEASEHLQAALANKKINWNQRTIAKRRLKDLEKRIPTLSFELPGGFEGSVFVDEELLEEGERVEPIAVNPGSRQVRVEAEGFLPFKETFELAEGESKTVTVLLTEEPKPVAPPVVVKEEATSSGKGQRTLGYVSLAVGGAGLVVGTAMGLAARSTRNELDASCPNNRCSESERDLFDKGETQATYATAGFIVGGVGLTLGTVLLLTAKEDKEKSPADQARVRLTPVLGPGQVGVYGSF